MEGAQKEKIDLDMESPELEMAALKIQSAFRKHSKANKLHPDEKTEADFPQDPDIFKTGLKTYWSSVNHIAIVVTDIGRSVGFYANVIGMQQVIRPDFDR